VGHGSRIGRRFKWNPEPREPCGAGSANGRAGSRNPTGVGIGIGIGIDPDSDTDVDPETMHAKSCIRIEKGLTREPGPAVDQRKKRPGVETAGALVVINACRLPYEEHLLVCRQWPEIVGDQALELIGDLAHGVHGRDDRVAVIATVIEG
jgi:hypothetical protein